MNTRQPLPAYAPLLLLGLLALSGCAAQPLCPPPELVRPVIPANLLQPPPTDQEWDRMLDRALSSLTHQPLSGSSMRPSE